MEDPTTFTRRYVQLPFYLLVPVVVVLALLGGGYVGRECVITCDRAQGDCRVTTAGYLYPIVDESVPIDSILGVAQTREETRHRSGRGASSSVSTTEYDVVFQLDPTIAHRPWLEVLTLDRLSSGDASAAAAQALVGFLNTPEQATVTASFGSHRTGYLSTLLILIVGLGAVGFFYCWQLTSKVTRRWSRESPETRLRFAVEVPFLSLPHGFFDLVVNGGKPPVTDEKWVAKLPSRSPPALRAEIFRIVQQEYALFDEEVARPRKEKKRKREQS